MKIGVYRATYQHGDDTFTVLMPVSDWLKDKAIDEKENAALLAIRAEFVAFVLRRHKKLVDPDMKSIKLDRLRNATILDQIKSVFHVELSP